MKKCYAILLFLYGFTLVKADTPANCTYEDLIGTWKIYLTEVGTRSEIDCNKKPGKFIQETSVTFSEFNKVIKETDGEEGTFTLIYNQGFEFDIGNRNLFAFFEWKQINKSHSQYWCNRTMFGWEHDDLGQEWRCFVAVKQPRKLSNDYTRAYFPPHDVIKSYSEEAWLNRKFINNDLFIDELNKAQSSWKAGGYDDLEKLTNAEVLKLAGHGIGKATSPKVEKKPLDSKSRLILDKLPESFDWRNVNGMNYLSPVRNQGQCGSCYTFASAGMLESRIRIMTNNTQTPVFSTQEIVSCGKYSQGCEGGFPYLIAGKYAQDFGLVEESCYPYEGKDTSCKPVKPNCRRHYVKSYSYVGGYYGACTEELMRVSLVQNGPIAVGFEVYSDFMQYKGGIYHHVFNVKNPLGFNPFELTNHAVLVVGYGSEGGQDYWTVKNSWGESWGEKGYFRIRRGSDECGIESLAQESFPVTDF